MPEKVTLNLNEFEADALLEFCAQRQYHPSIARMSGEVRVKHDVATKKLRSVMLARVHMRVSVAQVKRASPYKVVLPLEEALGLLAEWTAPPFTTQHASSMALVMGTIDQALA